MTTKIAIFSDPHIGCHSNSEVWHSTAIQFAKFMKRKLKKEGIERILMTGDFFDNRNEIGVQTLHVAGQFMDILEDFEITLIAGNHDMFYKHRNDVNSISIFDGRSNVTVITDTKEDMLDKLNVAYVPWGCSIDKIDNCDIMFGHFEINGFYMMVGKASDGKTHPKTLLDKTDLVFSGHFHLKDERKFKNGTIVYVGSPYQITWGEMTNIPGFYVLDTDDKTYKFIENTISPRHKKINPDKIFKKDIKNNIISVDFGDMVEEDREKIRNTIFSMNPQESRFTGNVQSIDAEDSKNIEYDTDTNLITIMLDFAEELGIDHHLNEVKEKLKELFEKHSD